MSPQGGAFLFLSLLFLGLFLQFFMEGVFFWVVLELMFFLVLLLFIFKGDAFYSIFVVFFCEIFFSLAFLFFCVFSSAPIGLLFLLGKLGLFPFWVWMFRLFEIPDGMVWLLVISVYKFAVLYIIFQNFLTFKMLLVILALNFSISLGVFFFFHKLEFFICSLSLFSVGWLVSTGEFSVLGFFSYFLIYLFFALCLYWFFSGSISGFWFLVFFLLYIGFPPFPPFFVKILNLSVMLEESFFLSLVVFLSVVVFFSCLWWMSMSLSKRMTFMPIFLAALFLL